MSEPIIQFSLTYTIGGETYTLNGYDNLAAYTFNLLEFTDVGLPSIERITQRGAFQHGDTNIDYRLSPRIFSIRGLVEAANSFEHMKVRDTISKMFKVNNTAGTITITSTRITENPPPGGGYTVVTTQRAIDCVVNGGLNFTSETSTGYDVYYDVQLRADNPVWYDPNPNTLVITNSVAGNPTDIPAVIPRTYGSQTINNTTYITYDATFLTYPDFTIFGGDGGITDLAIYNITQGTVVRITSIPANTTYYVNLRYGNKTVTDQNGSNVTYVIDPASNFTTFAIVPGTNLTSTQNIITVESDSSSANAYVIMTYYNQYTAV